MDIDTYFPVCSSSCTEAARGNPSTTLAIMVINTMMSERYNNFISL